MSAAARSATCTPASTGKEILTGRRPRRSTPARCTPSWARTARARARSRRCSRAARRTRSRGARCSSRARTCSALAPEERAVAGVFLAFQYPVEIPGVGNIYFLRTALNARAQGRGAGGARRDGLPALAKEKMKLVEMDRAFMNRSVNEGFSGGEKKRNEIFQMAVLDPKLAILDETDSGLDIDALRIVAGGVNALRAAGPRRCSSSRTTSGCSTTSCRTASTCWRAGGSSSRAARSWRSSSSRRATPGSSRGWPREARPWTRPAATGVAERCSSGAAAAARAWLTQAPPAGARRASPSRASPTPKDEDWKYTSLGAVRRPRLSSADAERRLAVGPDARSRGSGRVGRPAPRLVFVDGRLRRRALRRCRGADGLSVMALSDVRAHSGGAARLPSASAETRRFTALNTALREDGRGRRASPRASMLERRSSSCSSRPGRRRGATRSLAQPACTCAGRAARRRCVERLYVGRGRRGAVVHQRGDRGRARDEARLQHCQAAGRAGRARSTSDHCASSRGGTAASPRTPGGDGRRALGAQRGARSSSAAEGGECSLNGLYVGPRQAAPGPTTRASTTRSRAAPAASCTRASWPAQARGVFNGPGARAPGRAEDRRDADQQEPPALGRRAMSTPSRSSRSSPTT